MRLRSYLVALTLAAVLPLAVFAAAIGAFVLDQQRETFRRGAQDRALAVITAVDSELHGHLTTLNALAHARGLDVDLTLFRATAAQILAVQPEWDTVNLALPNGQQIMNVLVPEGVALPAIAETPANLAQLNHEQRPIIGDVVFGPTTRRWDFAVRVPVVREGKVVYILSAVVKPASIERLLAGQQLPSDWEAVVLDRNGRIVARATDSQASVGRLAAEGLRDALMRAPSGWFREDTLAGGEAYRVYRRSDASGWTFAMAMPASALDQAYRPALAAFILGLIGTLAFALVLARAIARRISQPISALAAGAEVMARGEPIELGAPSRIAELRALESALLSASEAQTRLQRAEEQNRSVVDHVVDSIITIDTRGTIESFNRAAEKLFGYRAAEVVGQNVKILMPEPYRAAHDGYIANYLGTGHAKIIGSGREVVGLRKDGSTFPIELAVSEFRIGTERFFTGIVRDITERKRAEEALREADRQKDEFLAMVSHELRNPLAALAAAAQVLRAAMQSDATIASAAGVVERQTRHMTRLIEDLIDVTRVRMGKITLEREQLDLAELVRAVVSAWRESRRLEGRAAVRVVTSPAWLEGDRARLEQIVSNLLDNALKCTPAAGHIDLTVGREGDSAVLRVADSGRGIDPHALGRIFGSFIQGERPTPGERGLGLGLAVVQRLTELHGGTVSAASEGLGRGATFTVRFPAVEARDQSFALQVVDALRDERRGREAP